MVSINQKTRTILFKPGGEEENGWPCWWYFRVDGIRPGTELTLTVKDPEMGHWARPDRASCSIDGKTWKHTRPGRQEGESITYRQVIGANRAWFAWGPPFVVKDAVELVARMSLECEGAEAFTLARSLNGRPVPALRVVCGEKPAEERRVVWVQARQHAWECGSSWVARGFVEWLMGENAMAGWLREHAEIVFVPVMDVDNVATGNGGKNQIPHDHNRDWSDDPIYPPVREAQEMLKQYARADRLDVYVDLHNPGQNKKAFFMTPPFELMDQKTREAFKRFADICSGYIRTPIPFNEKPHEMGAGYDNRWKEISNIWVVRNTREGVVGLTLEIPWNTPASTTRGYMTVGRQLGMGIAGYLRNPGNQKK